MSRSGKPVIGVLGVGGYLPDRVVTNADLALRADVTDDWVVSRTGIRTRRVASADESTADLAVAAARVALADAGLAPGDIDEIVVATETPEAFFPDTAAFVQDRLGAREIPAYDLGGSGCAGFVLALDIARTRAQAGRRILVTGV